jgi:hypothetical protein
LEIRALMPAYSFKKRFVPNIRAGLGLIGLGNDSDGNEIPCEFVIDDGSTVARPFDPLLDLDPPVHPKFQTIRSKGKRRHARYGEIVQLYHGMRTKHCFKIGDGRCSGNSDIYIGFGAKIDIIRIFGVYLIEHKTAKDLDGFSRKDGFNDWADMRGFWAEEHPDVKDFHGVLIEWKAL